VRVRHVAFALLVAAAVTEGAWAVDFDYCAGAIATNPEHPDEALRGAAAQVDEHLRNGLKLYNENASLLQSGWMPATGGGAAVLAKRRALWFAVIGDWLNAQRAICACIAQRGLEPGLCTELATVSQEACSVLPPPQPHYIDLERLTNCP